MLKIIAAVAENGVIGRGSEIPWHLSTDLKWFKQRTSGHPVVMGRKTYDSILERLGRPLPGRENLVLSRNSHPQGNHTWEEILGRSRTEDIFVIGGAEVYNMALSHADELYLTRVHAEVSGDVFFPELQTAEWNMVWQVDHASGEKDDHPFSWEIYYRKNRFVEMGGIRTAEQRQKMEAIVSVNHCPFCPENLSTYHPNPKLWEGRHWIVTENQWPYTGSRLHLVAILKYHNEQLDALVPGIYTEIGEMMEWAQRHFDIEGGAFLLRFGEPIRSGATVRHTHAHIVVPELGKALAMWTGHDVGEKKTTL